jgi:hypothetical protein
MRRTILLLAFVVVATLVAVPIAYAATFRCDEVPCIGTNGKDKIRERVGNGKGDHIRALGRADDIKANRYSRDRDRLDGGAGSDELKALDGDAKDVLNGGSGDDVCVGDQGDSFRSCEVMLGS